MKSKVFKLAWALVKRVGLNIREALSRAWKAIQLKAELEGTDERGKWISFVKEDGTRRNAMATRNLNHLEEEDKPKNTKPSKDLLTITFWDILEGAWRSFRVDRLILNPNSTKSCNVL